MSSAPESEGRPFRALIPIALVLLGVPWAFKLTDTRELGAPCGAFDCAVIEGRCVQGKDGPFCTIVCSDDSQCPESGHCGVPPHDYHRVRYSESPLSELVCVPGPRPERAPRVEDFPQHKAAHKPANTDSKPPQARPPEQRSGG